MNRLLSREAHDAVRVSPQSPVYSSVLPLLVDTWFDCSQRQTAVPQSWWQTAPNWWTMERNTSLSPWCIHPR